MEIYRQEQQRDCSIEINRTFILDVNTKGNCGCQFIKPVSGFECSICKIFLRSEDHIEEHFSSFQHVTIYQIHLRSHVEHQNGQSLTKDHGIGQNTGDDLAAGDNYGVKDCDAAGADFDRNLSEHRRQEMSLTPCAGLSFIAVEACATAPSRRDQNWPQAINSEDIKNHCVNETSDANNSLETSTDNVAMKLELDTFELNMSVSPNNDKCNEIYVPEKGCHDSTHANKMLYSCDVCGKFCRSRIHLTMHQKTHQEKQLTEDESKPAREKSCICDDCGKAFTHNSALAQHKRVHSGERPYACDVCSKSFKFRQYLYVHNRIHTGEKPYSCDVCDKAFNQSSALKTHKRIHTGEQPFSCDLCHRTFNQSSTLKTHKRTHAGEKPYSCDMCDRAFNQSAALQIHKQRHTKHKRTLSAGEKSFICDTCGKAFSHNTSLMEHKRVHSGERPFSCDVCKKAFKDHRYLKVHKRIHTGERPYACDVCGKAFNQPSTLKTHKQIHNRGK